MCSRALLRCGVLSAMSFLLGRSDLQNWNNHIDYHHC